MPSVRTVQDNDNDNHSSASDSSDREPHARTPHISQDQGPEVENLTSYSRRRRHKSRRRTMGMERSEYIVRGNDPFDYEQKFPEDKQHEELGPTARVWRTYLEECVPFDIEMVEGWRDGLDVLLVFAGLFSAVVTTFVAQTSQSLQVDYGAVTASLLIELINVQRSASNGSLVNDVPHSDLTFHPSASDSWVNGLWFTSLSLSLTTALFAVLTKQWIHQYMSVPSGTPQDRCRVRQFRYMGLQQWGVAFIIGLLPVLMSASLAVFLVGLVLFIVPLRVSIASVVGAITFISFSAYMVTNFLPILYPSCPYKTPLSQYMFPLYTYILHNGVFNWLISPISKLGAGPPHKPTSDAPAVRTLRGAERAAVDASADETDVQALSWLIHMSSNPSVEKIVIESTGALPLKSVHPLERHIAHISRACSTALETIVRGPDISMHESQVDRLLRAHLRFEGLYILLEIPQNAKECLSPAIYAELLSICMFCETEIRELVISNLKAGSYNPTALRLQPIVWAYLLQKLDPSTPDNFGVMQILFTMIPPFYWSADFTPPTQFIECCGIKILYGDTAVATLGTAIQESLYLYVAEVILRHHQCAIFPLNPAYVFPSQDWRLHLLLSMADSPSIRSMPISTFPFDNSLFIRIMQGIGDFLGVKSLLSYDGDIIPTVPLDDNRRAVLKLLYTLISSVEFDDTLPLPERNFVLIIFLRVLNSTSPRPPFLPKDWCTPELATKFVRNALDSEYTSQQYPSAYELGTYFLRSTSFTDKTAAYFVSSLFEHLRTHDSSLALLRFLYLIVTVLASENSDIHIRQQSLEYLYEPDNLFTSCTTLIQWDDTKTLRHLALLRPKDRAWTDCLQQLQDKFPEGTWFHPHIVADFKAFITGGCVGAFGTDDHDAASSNTVQPARREDDNSPHHPWSTVWRRVRRFIAGKPSREEIELSNNDARV
ncbi:uncharacterized protein EV420DRAFT_1765585 [Desarmillaria tabescens]|uniref:DUF6535 domain-containing protein n=1 Tax=Armillaria tabescens TaxID=1929756 RepID=A0AA39KB36_ARMTA|nr:uncharacterized protein EV420DRAFT_1765585 [Desarmillaria tabescens]KAK0455548.1 hypothetical protein EV420DRAFT_1765585 [Desarmillaria tabescens]